MPSIPAYPEPSTEDHLNWCRAQAIAITSNRFEVTYTGLRSVGGGGFVQFPSRLFETVVRASGG